ncbi:MAG: type II secretion system F family protein [Candidatus Aenigmarchaeota archaeon]|nr:type II secretion system F family protein [Candidatus Aenigmarchaeota archaeon]
MLKNGVEMTTYSRLCYQFFGDSIKPLRKYFLDMKKDLQKAGMNFTLDEYLSMAVFTSVIMFLSETVILSFIFGLFFAPLIAVSLSITLSLSLSGLVFFLFYSYPMAVSKGRGESIDKVLPFAVSYLSAIASGNVSPYYLFKTISRFKEYGEISKESGSIARNIKIFGMNFSDAIKREATRTPSKNFRELLYGINTIITSGADLRSFLKNKADLLIDDYRRRIRKYSQDLSVIVEIYLTLIIVGSIFFIVLTSIMGSAGGGGTIGVQSFIVFILLPLTSIGFIVIMKFKSPMK